ncbi:MAG: LacI family DNA-binding transcriptional regulator [Blautia wexlerae]
MGKVRMADIAAKVGVSTVTVHNALAGNKGVSDEMREKIQKVADELGYHQMTAAAKREEIKVACAISVSLFQRNIWRHILHFTGKCIRSLQWLLLIRTVWQQWKS